MRKTLYALFVLILISLALLLVFSSQFSNHELSSRDNWRLYRHDAANIGSSSGPAPISSDFQWNYTLESDATYSPNIPLVVDGRIYVSSNDYKLYCIDGSTGKEVWNFPTAFEKSYCPAVIDGRVYVGSGEFFRGSINQGCLYCLDASSGSQIWNYSIGDDLNSPVNFWEGKVYVISRNGSVHCFEAQTGEKIWNFSMDAEGDCPAIADGFLYATNKEGEIFCLNATSGVHIWNITMRGSLSSPVAIGGFIYVGSSDGNAYCLDASDGIKIWNYTTWYNAAGPAHGYEWGNTVSAPAVNDGRVYVGSSDFDIFCLDAATGNKIWNFSTGGIASHPPTIAGECVFAGSYDGNLYCLNSTSGLEIWRYPAGVFSPVSASGSVGSPVVSDGIVYVVGNGVLSAIGACASSPK
jgi:outer membrane protein assembly factor BamB